MGKGRWRITTVVALLGAVALTGCTAAAAKKDSAGAPAATSPSAATGRSAGSSAPSKAAVPPPVVHLDPAAGTKDITPTAPITASVTDGTLASVALVNAAGTKVTGALAANGKSWQATEPLGYGKSYTLTATARNADGVASKTVSSFTTVTPQNFTMPYLNTTGGADIVNGATYGVGMVINVHWDEAIADHAAAQKSVTVTTTPKVAGAWYWANAQDMHWRPQAYYAAGTKVNVVAHAYGVQVGPGLYGQADAATSFKIGESHVSIADDNTHQVYVYVAGKLVRTMPTAMGRGGYVQGTHGSVSLYTPPGTYTVIGQGNPVLMDSSTFGLPTNSPLGYKENIYWATRISTDGIFLHALASTIWAQGNTDVSHGCLNLSPDNAQWYYQMSLVGDVVTVKNTGGAALQVWQNGDWTVPWATWVKGGASS